MQLTTTTSKRTYSREWHNEGVRLLDSYAQYRLLGALQQVGLFTQPGEQRSITEIKNHLSLLEKYNRLFDGLMEILNRCEFVRIEGTTVTTLEKATAVDTRALIAQYNSTNRLTDDESVNTFCQTYVRMIGSTATQFTDVLSGEKTYLDALFPKGSFELAEGIYTGNVQTYINNKAAALVKAEVQRRHAEDSSRVINILEVGAGTGMSAVKILESIGDYSNCVQFWYTDLGKSFVRRAKRKFGEEYPFMKFQALDIDKCPVEQGFEAGSIDIIVCNNVVHATPSITNTLKNISILSSKGGYVVVNDVSKRYDYNTVTFGLADGWWLFQDPDLRIQHSPVLANVKMEELLQGLGYEETRIQGLDALNTDEHGQSITTGYKRS